MTTVPNPEYVLELATKLVEAKNRVASLQKEWDELFHTNHNPAPATNSTLTVERVEDMAAELDLDGITGRFLHFLESFKPRAFTVAEIAYGIEVEPIQVHRAIGRLLPKGKIKRAERGKYQAPDSAVANAA